MADNILARQEIADELNQRSQQHDHAMAQVNAMNHSESRVAFRQMALAATAADKGLPGVMLVADSNQHDNLDPGGYNAFIGAKVPSGAVGVVTQFGKVYAEPLSEGWNWKSPLKHVIMVSTRLQADTVKAQAASQDLQQVTTELTVPFSLKASSAPQVYQKIGNLEQVEAVVINPGVLESVKAVTAKYTAEELITKREEVKMKVEDALKHYVDHTLEEKGLSGAVDIGNVAITHFDFSEDFNRSIELKVKAVQDALRAENEKRQKVTEAEATRDSQKAKADGEAYAIEVKSKAEAAAIQRRADALKANPHIVDLNAVEKWDGKLPVYTGNGQVPFINLKDIKEAQDQPATNGTKENAKGN